MDNFYTRYVCSLLAAILYAKVAWQAHPESARSFRTKQSPFLCSCQPPHCHHQSHPVILRLIMSVWLPELCLLASVVHAHGLRSLWSICCVLMQRSPAGLRVKELGTSEANGSLSHPKKRSARIKHPKWRLLWRAGEGLQCHTAPAATVAVFFCERHEEYVDKTYKCND